MHSRFPSPNLVRQTWMIRQANRSTASRSGLNTGLDVMMRPSFTGMKEAQCTAWAPAGMIRCGGVHDHMLWRVSDSLAPCNATDGF